MTSCEGLFFRTSPVWPSAEEISTVYAVILKKLFIAVNKRQFNLIFHCTFM